MYIVDYALIIGLLPLFVNRYNSIKGRSDSVDTISVVGCLFSLAVFLIFSFITTNPRIGVKKVELKTNIIKSKTSVYVEYDGGSERLTSHEDYINIDSSTVFYKKEYYNWWGFSYTDSIVVKNK